MLNKIFGLFGKSSISLKDQLEKAKLSGNLYEKDIGRKRKVLADECTIFLTIEKENPASYNLNIHFDEDDGDSNFIFNFRLFSNKIFRYQF